MSAAVILASITAALAQEPGQGPGPGRGGRGGQGPFPGGRFGGPVRDNAEPASGTARITGRVVAADTGTPIRRAQIRIIVARRALQPHGHDRRRRPLRDRSLPAGRYRLFVSKAGYVALEYGQARPFEAGKPLDITDGQALDKIDFSLPRGSVITGRITDEFGDPITDVQVQAMRYQFVNGERQLVNAGRQSTDRRSRPVPDLRPDAGRLRRSGVAAPESAPRRQRCKPARRARSGYPGTYFPGVIDVGQAQTVTVTLGQELSSVAFPLVPARLARVSGTVMSSDGRPLAGAVVVLRPPPAAGWVCGSTPAGGGNQVRADGTFRLIERAARRLRARRAAAAEEPQSRQNLPDLRICRSSSSRRCRSACRGDIDNLAVVTTPGVTRVGPRGVSGTERAEGLDARRAVSATRSRPAHRRSWRLPVARLAADA